MNQEEFFPFEEQNSLYVRWSIQEDKGESLKVLYNDGFLWFINVLHSTK